MAVAFISDVVVTSSADSGSQSVTVPSDADCCVIGIGGWTGGSRVLMPPTAISLAGSAFTGLQSDNNNAHEKMHLARLVGMAPGSQTYSWDMGGSGSVTEGLLHFLTFFKNVDQANPIVASGLTNGNVDVTGLGSPGAGDMMVGLSAAFGSAPTVTGSGQTSMSTPAAFNQAIMRGAYKLGASSYDITAGDDPDFNTHAACVLRAAAVAAQPRFSAQLIG